MATDDRLRDALRSAAQEPSIDGVAERVQSKRSRRRTARRLQAVGTVAVVVALVAVGSVVLTEDERRQVSVPPAASRGGPVVRVADRLDLNGRGSTAKVARIQVEGDDAYVRGPLQAIDGVITFVSYARDGSTFSFPPSHIVRVRPNGTVVDRIDLQGEILSLSEGEGARWALTRDKTVLGPEDPEFRVKRIGPNGTVASNPVPPGEMVLGDIVAAGGGVWVPTRDGVLRFDVVTGEFAGKTFLHTGTDRRAVASLGKGVGVTDGADVLRLDPSTDLPSDATAFGAPERAPDGWEYVDLVRFQQGNVALARRGGSDRWLLAVTRIGDRGVERSQTLLPDMIPTNLSAVGDDIFVTGDVHGRLAVFQLTDNFELVERTITLRRVPDADLSFTSARRAVVVAGGVLFRISIPK